MASASVVCASSCFGALAHATLRSLYARMVDKTGREPQEQTVVYQEPLHWKDEHFRPGLGELLHRVNHIALIVRDVGYSCSFYTEVIGFQQIRRPNFDRHGAWLTMGNIELHLIKGVPVTAKGQHPADLIVPHISIETMDIKAVKSRLVNVKQKYPDLFWRQNVSVPTAEASKEAHFESDHTNDDGKIIQFFVEDPDGYWMEFCNCDELTDFCLGQEPYHNPTYSADLPGVRIQARAMMYIQIKRWIKRARISLQKQRESSFLQKDLATSPVPEEQVDAAKLANFVARMNTYGDICQAFKVDELRALLARAGNDAPTAVLMMRQKVIRTGQQLVPPAYLVDSTSLQVCDPMMLNATRRNSWFEPGWMSSAIRRLSMMSMMSGGSRRGSWLGSRRVSGESHLSPMEAAGSRFGPRQFSTDSYSRKPRLGSRQVSSESSNGFTDSRAWTPNPMTPSAPLAIVRELSTVAEQLRADTDTTRAGTDAARGGAGAGGVGTLEEERPNSQFVDLKGKVFEGTDDKNEDDPHTTVIVPAGI